MQKFFTAFLKDKTAREDLILRIISSWSITGIVLYLTQYADVDSPEFFIGINHILALGVFAGSFIVLSVLKFFVKKPNTDFLAFPVTVLLYLSYCVSFLENNYLTLGACILSVFVTVYTVNRIRKKGISIKNKTVITLCITAGSIVTLFMITIGVCRYLTFSCPNYDFGIFAQNFYYLKKTFKPLSTLERQKLLSHFSVHLSPIFYTVLPFYFIFPHPVTLQVLQALIIGSGLIPLYLLCKHYKLSPKITLFFIIGGAFYPALAGGTMYDFHENAFLFPLILWMLYFFEKDKYLPGYIFMVLVFAVKEDAPVYVAFIALYFILSARKILRGFTMLFSSAAYFSLALIILNRFGEGVMSDRYDNLIMDEKSGLLSVIITFFENPAYVISECMNEEKLIFILFMILPVAGLPFITKKWSRFILLGPMVLINLMSDYTYQHSIYFQYIYGVAAILMYLSVMNLSDMKNEPKYYFPVLSSVMSALIFISALSPQTVFVDEFFNFREEHNEIRAVLSEIPDDASVNSSTFFIPYLSQRDEIYEIEYSGENTDYLVLDLRSEAGRKIKEQRDFSQYTLLDGRTDIIEVYKKN